MTPHRTHSGRRAPLRKVFSAALPAALAACAGPAASAAPSPAAVQPCTYPHGTALTHLPDGRTVAEAFAASARAAVRDPGAQAVDVPPGASLPELENRQEVARGIGRNYPPELRDQLKTGAVTVYVLIAADGTVADAVFLRRAGEPAFDAAALNVIRVMRFRPAQVGGCAVPAFSAVPVTFEIRT